MRAFLTPCWKLAKRSLVCEAVRTGGSGGTAARARPPGTRLALGTRLGRPATVVPAVTGAVGDLRGLPPGVGRRGPGDRLWFGRAGSRCRGWPGCGRAAAAPDQRAPPFDAGGGLAAGLSAGGIPSTPPDRQPVSAAPSGAGGTITVCAEAAPGLPASPAAGWPSAAPWPASGPPFRPPFGRRSRARPAAWHAPSAKSRASRIPRPGRKGRFGVRAGPGHGGGWPRRCSPGRARSAAGASAAARTRRPPARAAQVARPPGSAGPPTSSPLSIQRAVLAAAGDWNGRKPGEVSLSRVITSSGSQTRAVSPPPGRAGAGPGCRAGRPAGTPRTGPSGGTPRRRPPAGCPAASSRAPSPPRPCRRPGR